MKKVELKLAFITMPDKGNPHFRRISSLSIQSSSAAIIGGVDDLLIEIFQFLPARSLVRFKSVSKHWCSLISTHSFARLHILHHPCRRPEPTTSFILSGWFPQFFICDAFSRKLLQFDFRLPYVKILQSCNGLLLLECRHSPFSTTLVMYAIFNPTTMQSRILIDHDAPLLLGLFFDPSKSPYYRVVCRLRSNDDDLFLDHLLHGGDPADHPTHQISVYDSQTNTWKEEEGTYQVDSVELSDNGVYWNNGVYFLRPLQPQLTCLSSDGSIRDVEPPPIVLRVLRDGETRRNYIMEAGGHLHYLVLFLMLNDNSLVVYEMTDDGSDWVIKYTADFNPISRVRSFKCCLIGLIRGDVEEESVVMFHVPGKIISYKFSERVFEVLVNFKAEDYYEAGVLQFGLTKPAFPFIGTLADV